MIPIGGGATEIAVVGGEVWVGADDVHGSDNVLVVLDAESNEIVDRVFLNVQPWELTASSGAVWVTGSRGGVARVDRETHRVTVARRRGAANPGPLASGNGSVWTVETEQIGGPPAKRLSVELVRLLPSTGEVSARTPIGRLVDGYVGDIAVAAGSVWVMEHELKPGGTREECGDLIRVDVATNRVVDVIPARGLNLGVGPGGVWVTCRRGYDNFFARPVDPSSSAVGSTVNLPPGGYGPLAVRQRAVWFTGYNRRERVEILRMDPESLKIRRWALLPPGHYSGATFDARHEAVWVATGESVTRVDMRP